MDYGAFYLSAGISSGYWCFHRTGQRPDEYEHGSRRVCSVGHEMSRSRGNGRAYGGRRECKHLNKTQKQVSRFPLWRVWPVNLREDLGICLLKNFEVSWLLSWVWEPHGGGKRMEHGAVRGRCESWLHCLPQVTSFLHRWLLAYSCILFSHL